MVDDDQDEVKLVSIEDEGYPPLLREVVGAPVLLYVKGEVTTLSLPVMAVVGTRRMSREGERKTEAVVKKILSEGMGVVSGLAYGVDAKAHQVCLEEGGKTVAVMAHGLDMVYPEKNKGLAEKIIESGGVLASELPLGVGPERYYFPMRNRLIVGMSLGLVVVECEENSGSMTSVNHAAEMGRTVFAVPGSPGTDLLLAEGVNEMMI